MDCAALTSMSANAMKASAEREVYDDGSVRVERFRMGFKSLVKRVCMR